VEPGEDYHIVVAVSDSAGGAVDLLAETAGPTSGRSATFDGSSWSGTGNDLVIRAQVRTDVTPPPAVADLTTERAEPQNISIGWSEASAPDLSGYLVYRDTSPIGTSPGSVPFDTTEANATSYTDTKATEGRTYYYRVASLDRSGSESEAAPPTSAFLYPGQVQAQFSQGFGSGGSESSDYRLLALPGAVDQDVGDLLPGQSEVDWSVFFDNGSQEDFLVEYDGSETFNFQPGRGFWAVSTEEVTAAESFETVSLQADTATTIPLHDGWNIISNPFGKTVPWSAVRAANSERLDGGQLQPPFGFEGSFSRRDALASAETGQAFYFLNDQGLSQLTIPYPGGPEQPAGQSAQSRRALAAKSSSEGIVVKAAPTGRSEASSSVRIFSASGRKTPLDVVAPTRQFEDVSLRIRTEATGDSRQKFLAATGRDLSKGQSIPLALQADTNSVQIRLNKESLGNEKYSSKSVVLISESGGRTYELTNGASTEVPVGSGSSQFKLAVGTDAYVDEEAQSAAPESVQLTTAPNPFRQRTTLRYTLPEQARVRLEIYDVLGRQVASPVDTRKEAGRHRTDFSAQNLSSGVYFGRLKVGETVVTQKLTVVR
jgi:hypothetical protein